MLTHNDSSQRSYHHGDLRETLMEAALASIAAHGTEKLSLRALAREAGVSATAPYRHFPSKQSLLAALAEEGFQELRSRFDRVAAQTQTHADLEQRLLALGMAYVDFALAHSTTYELMFGRVLGDFSEYESLQRAAEGCYGVLYRMLEEGLSPQGARALTATRLGGVVWAAVHGVASLLLHHRGICPSEHPENVRASLYGMMADPAAALRILLAGIR
jgi:AcrR family transcriptional regulator